jgi:hypothetical protein
MLVADLKDSPPMSRKVKLEDESAIFKAGEDTRSVTQQLDNVASPNEVEHASNGTKIKRERGDSAFYGEKKLNTIQDWSKAAE